MGRTAAAVPLAPVILDGLTASADATFRSVLAGEDNLPAGYGRRLTQLLT